jgi:hypothetical protein
MHDHLHFSFQIPCLGGSAPRGMRPSIAVAVSLPLFFFAAVVPTAEPQQPLPALIKVAAVQMLGYDKTDIPAMFQNEVVLIATNRSYGAGTMIGQWPARIMASCPEPKESYSEGVPLTWRPSACSRDTTHPRIGL